MDASLMANGEPGLPMAFVCKKKLYQVDKILKKWRDTGPCTHGSGEKYVRKNWFEVLTIEGDTLTLYFERRSIKGRPRRGWRLFSTS